MINIVAQIDGLEETVLTLDQAIDLKRCVGTKVNIHDSEVSVDDVELTFEYDDELQDLSFLVDFEDSVIKKLIDESKADKENHFANSGVAKFYTNWADEIEIYETVVVPEKLSNTLIKWDILSSLMDSARTDEDTEKLQSQYEFNPDKDVILYVGSNQDVTTGFYDLSYVPATKKELEVIERLEICPVYETSNIRYLIMKLETE